MTDKPTQYSKGGDSEKPTPANKSEGFKSVSAVPSKRICEWCQEPNTRFAGSPYMADTADMCINCYAFTYQNHKDELMPWDMVEINNV